MSLGFLASIFSGVIGVAFVATLLGSPNLASTVKNLFDGFAGALKAAKAS